MAMFGGPCAVNIPVAQQISCPKHQALQVCVYNPLHLVGLRPREQSRLAQSRAIHKHIDTASLILVCGAGKERAEACGAPEAGVGDVAWNMVGGKREGVGFDLRRLARDEGYAVVVGGEKACNGEANAARAACYEGVWCAGHGVGNGAVSPAKRTPR